MLMLKIPFIQDPGSFTRDLLVVGRQILRRDVLFIFLVEYWLKVDDSTHSLRLKN